MRVYATTSTHKSLSCFRQGSYIMVNDDCWESTEASFKEAFFTHTSTSPNLQLIASLDVARRQAELEGYELVGRAIELSLILRREVNKHPLISKYFRIATNAQMVPDRTPGQRIRGLPCRWCELENHLRRLGDRRVRLGSHACHPVVRFRRL